jgi:short-subunit dehydrogenase
MARRSIAGLRVIVTGASSGIGRALVLELIRSGAKVVAFARRAERLEELKAAVSDSANLRCLAGDVTRREDRAAALELSQRDFGGLDALVNNAGVGALGRFDQADEARLRHIMEVNLFAPAEFIREALPTLRAATKPIIVNVSSVLGHRAVPEKSEYCASKFALHGLSDALRTELATDGIDVLLVSPSTTVSEFFDVASSGAPRRTSRFGAMSAESVARQMITAMRSGRREIILSLSGKLLVWIDRLCPPLADWIVARWA